MPQWFGCALLVAMLLALGGPPTAGAATVLISLPTVIAEANLSYDGADLVISNCAVAINGSHQFASLSLVSGATLTHPAATSTTTYGLDVTVAGVLQVDSTSQVDVSGCGYLAGRTLGNVTEGAATSPSWSSTPGGSYGGLGGVPSGSTCKVYGDYRNPNELGSGGAIWGAGGGLVRISAQSIEINGRIVANGQSCGGYEQPGCAGSGGGIRLDTEVLAGTGTVTANGGLGKTTWVPGAGGGGGRVAIYYARLDSGNPFNLGTNVTAHGGTGQATGSPGTVFLKRLDGEGQLRIDSHGTTTGAWTPLGVASDTQFEVDHLWISGPGVIVAPDHDFAIQAGRVTLLQGAVLTHLAATDTQTFSLRMSVTGTVTVDSTSRIDVTGKGYLAGRTLGNTTNSAAQTPLFGNTPGGSYGGLGGVPSGSTCKVYGDYRNPNELGSGGAKYSAGGGLVRISAQTMTIDGRIIANGRAGSPNYEEHGCAGSGGGIWLSTGTLGGSGSIGADGGLGKTSWVPGAGGGGGRIAIYYQTLDAQTPLNLEANVTAHGGTGLSHGSVGTVYLKKGTNQATLLLVSHGTTAGSWTPLGLAANADFVAENLIISGSGVAAAPDHELPIRVSSLSILNGAVLTHLAATESQTYSLRLNVTGAVLVVCDLHEFHLSGWEHLHAIREDPGGGCHLSGKSGSMGA